MVNDLDKKNYFKSLKHGIFESIKGGFNFDRSINKDLYDKAPNKGYWTWMKNINEANPNLSTIRTLNINLPFNKTTTNNHFLENKTKENSKDFKIKHPFSILFHFFIFFIS